MEETTDEKRARIIGEVAKARLAQLDRTNQEEHTVISSGKLTADKLNQLLGIVDQSKYNQNGKLNYEFNGHQKEFGSRKFIKP